MACNDTVETIRFPGGYFAGPRFVTCYYIKDYQGNNIAVVSGAAYAGKTQSTTYYPYGEPHRRPASSPGRSSDNRYLFGDKEYTDYYHESQLDFGARHLASSAIPRFTTMDPLCEKRPDESPYIFAAANPVMKIDPTGLEWYYYKDLLYDSVDDIKEVVKPTVELTILYCESKEDFERKRNAGEITRGEFLGDVVIDFHGSLNEKLKAKTVI